MAITAADIKLLASERMTDTSDGGGRRTSNVIPDGVAGNIFPKVSRLDSTYGRVNLRKIYGAVQTEDLDMYAGAHAILSDAPDNDKIHAALFSTGSDFDDRTAARDRIESYVVAGPESRMILFGRQLVGQQAVLVYQRPEEPLPSIGDVYCLSTETGGVVSYQQYIRISDVSQELRTFEDEHGTFDRRVITLKIGAPLRQEFAGPDVPVRVSQVGRASLVRATSVADAARYYGIQPITEDASEGDLTLRVSSVFTPIVPTTLRESPISAATIAGAQNLRPAASAVTDWLQISDIQGTSEGGHNTDGDYAFVLPRGAVPGTVRVKLTSYLGLGVEETPEAQDDEDGLINAVASSVRFINGGTIDYESGVVTINARAAVQFGTIIWVRYQPAVSVAQPSHTKRVEVTLGTRGTVYVDTLAPIPAAGTLIVDYRALGKWYRLRDDGSGAVKGDDPAFGTGAINLTTGSLIVTLGALPDVESAIIYSWGTPAHYAIRAGVTSDAQIHVHQRITVTDLPIKPTSLFVAYTSGGATYTGTDAAGVISGGGLTGTVNYASGEIALEYTTRLPDMDTNVALSYLRESPSTGDPTIATGVQTVADKTGFTLATGSIALRGVRLSVPAHIQTPYGLISADIILVDNGSGSLVTAEQTSRETSAVGYVNMHVDPGQIVGTVDYTSGDSAITATFLGTALRWNDVTSAWVNTHGDVTIDAGSYTYSIRTTAPSTGVTGTFNASLTDSPLFVDLTTTTTSTIVPGTVMLDLAGKHYIDRNGAMYADLDRNGAGTAAGTINYQSGEVIFSFWADNVAPAFSVQSCVTQYGNWVTTQASFRTAGSPIRPASFFVQVTAEDGESLTATADSNGVISGAAARGLVNQTMGVAHVEWGEMVIAAGNESEEWYDADNLVGSNIWKPRRVFPSTITYNCVVLSNLPLNADQLGLDPVRLPSDGRVPIYRPADVVVIHNTKSYTLANPAVASHVYDVGRTDLAELWLVDATAARVPSGKYVADPEAGTITMAADLDLTGIPQPLKAKHRIEELNLLSDVQINGTLGLTGALQRDYDTDTQVSSAMLFGDMFARVTSIFDQGSWTGTWSDSLSGSQATAQYDSINHPIEVINSGAVNERWRIEFLTTTTFRVIGENLGVIVTGSTADDLQPVNSLTSEAYFTLRAAGWGIGWGAGNQLRFNTVAATAPIWIARTILPGATLNGDSLDLQLRGDVDA